MRHLLTFIDVSPQEIKNLLREAAYLKAAQQRRIYTPMLMGRVVTLVFEKPSLRTRVSFQAAVAQMGGTSIFLNGNDVGLGSRETVADVARTISQYADAVVLRTFSHQTIEYFASSSTCPIINGLSDLYHPCQALADIFTVEEMFGDLDKRTIAFIGDGNNVSRSLAIICSKLGLKFILAAPKGYHFDKDFLKSCKKNGAKGEILLTEDPVEAVSQADIVYTDVWTSMGQEDEREERIKNFQPYQVNAKLMKKAPARAKIMHCLPARRGEEITGDVLDGEQSVVFPQAANRMHVQKALLLWLINQPPGP